MWCIRRANGLYCGFVHDWTDRLHETCWFETRAQADAHRTEYTWESDTYVAFHTDALQYVKMQLANITDDHVRANILALINRRES